MSEKIIIINSRKVTIIRSIIKITNLIHKPNDKDIFSDEVP